MLDFIGEDGSEAIERLAQSHGHGILELCAADLDDVFKLFCLAAESLDQHFVMLHEFQVGIVHADVDGRGIGVVG